VNRSCPESEELVTLLDGELTENRAADLRDHLAVCHACAGELDRQRRLVSRVAAPVPGLPSPGAVERIMRRLDCSEAPPRRPRSIHVLPALGALGVAAVVLALVVVLPRGVMDRGAFAARGATVDWTRKVGVELWALEGDLRKLTAGTTLAPGTALVASYRNVDAAPAYLLAFALDASGEAHWLYPAFVSARSDPEAVRLDASVTQRAFPESVVLEDLPPGPLRFVFVVSREPLHVSSIEGMAPSERDPEALRARWPHARIDELSARVAPSSPAAH
jgi:hypothetical protein